MRVMTTLLLGACIGLTGCGDEVALGNEAAPSGTELWEQQVPIYPFDVAVGHDGSIYVVGRGGSHWQQWLGKFGPDGSLLWSHEAGLKKTFAVSVVVGEDGGIYTAVVDLVDSADEVHVDRFNSDGKLVWTLAQEFRSLSELAAAPGGGVYAAGGEKLGDGVALLLQRIDADGTVQWSVNEPALSGVADIQVGAKGELLATGRGETWWAHMRDVDGGTGWTAELGPALGSGPFQAMAVDAHGAMTIVAGAQNDPAARGYLARLDADGALLATPRLLDRPPTNILQLGDSIVLANLIPPDSVEVQSEAGVILWTAAPPEDCWKTWGLATAAGSPDSPIIVVRDCGNGVARMAALQR